MYNDLMFMMAHEILIFGVCYLEFVFCYLELVIWYL